ncbi:MAG: four helix bundle protein [Chloroflexota bacterium]|nr:four helix bundle protein [Chloroflexota bacterium]MBI5705178.1 four helix bundle protein [Chloroflexota bacterium]
MSEKEPTFEEWQKAVPETIRAEKFWSLIAYQKALYLYSLLWEDTEKWRKDERGQALSKQIIGSSDSICSNIEEGFGRDLGKQLVQFYVYSLGSARETKGRIYRAKAFYTLETLNKRLNLASEVVALILTEINRQKGR